MSDVYCVFQTILMRCLLLYIESTEEESLGYGVGLAVAFFSAELLRSLSLAVFFVNNYHSG